MLRELVLRLCIVGTAGLIAVNLLVIPLVMMGVLSYEGEPLIPLLVTGISWILQSILISIIWRWCKDA